MKPDKMLYLAVKDGVVLSGAKGQYAFDDKGTLARSIAQSYRYMPSPIKKGDYEIIEFTLADIIKGKQL